MVVYIAHLTSATLPYHFESYVYRLVVYGHHPVAAAVQCHCVVTPHAEEVLGHRPSEERPGGTVRDVPLEVMAREGKGQRAWELVYVVSLQILDLFNNVVNGNVILDCVQGVPKCVDGNAARGYADMGNIALETPVATAQSENQVDG